MIATIGVSEQWGDDEGPQYGYHITKIEKGVIGEASKIAEEVSEFMDAIQQNVQVMALVELADLLGAIEAWLQKYHPSITLDDLRAMSFVTKRAFLNGYRG